MHQNLPPRLYLAPMEGVADRAFRRAMASIGGFDEACTEFIRVPSNGCPPSLAKWYDPHETAPFPIAAQLMGSDPTLMAEMTSVIVQRGAPRVDLNCGCPSNTVTGRGAGSSLLKDPQLLHSVAKAMCDATDRPVTAKLRSGFHDTSLFLENLFAAQESGIRFLTLHPRTKADGYAPPARWDLIAAAVQQLRIPVVGNGDILSAQDAEAMLEQTGCSALMIGRGAVVNPWIFWEIKSRLTRTPFVKTIEQLVRFLQVFGQNFSEKLTSKGRVNKVKQLGSYMLRANDCLRQRREAFLKAQTSSSTALLQELERLLIEGHFPKKGKGGGP